ncbi:MAG: hypothetical protein WDZ51_03980 [Pirellulaceae bacterium]
MTTIARREALSTIFSASAGMLLGGRRNGEEQSSGPDGEVALLRGTMNTSHCDGHRMTGFIETGVDGGLALCSLIDQDAENPAILSIFSEPCKRNGVLGAQITIVHFSDPVGEVAFSLLHIGGGMETSVAVS